MIDINKRKRIGDGLGSRRECPRIKYVCIFNLIACKLLIFSHNICICVI